MKVSKVFGMFAALAALLVVAVVSPPWQSTQAAGAPAISVFSAAYTTQFDLADGAGATLPVPAPGAILGDACVASLSVDAVDMVVSCYVQAAGAAEVRVQNESGGATDIAAGTARVFILPRGTR